MSSAPARHLHPSNLLTYCSLLAGLLAVVAAVELQSRALAGAFLALSVLADTLDGRFARLFDRDGERQRFGAQLDSLSDAVSFGFAPVFCVYSLLSFSSDLGRWIWFAAGFIYVLCAITRLGYYNLRSAQTADFIGVPVPVCGLLWSTYLVFPPSVTGSFALLLACSIAMVFPVRIPRPRGTVLHAFLSLSVLLTVVHGLSMWATKGSVL
jgi:CDP-diacylglycerol--serine O-phosphatidyltransferase